jgi:hypothetical protein
MTAPKLKTCGAAMLGGNALDKTCALPPNHKSGHHGATYLRRLAAKRSPNPKRKRAVAKKK